MTYYIQNRWWKLRIGSLQHAFFVSLRAHNFKLKRSSVLCYGLGYDWVSLLISLLYLIQLGWIILFHPVSQRTREQGQAVNWTTTKSQLWWSRLWVVMIQPLVWAEWRIMSLVVWYIAPLCRFSLSMNASMMNDKNNRMCNSYPL